LLGFSELLSDQAKLYIVGSALDVS
jgi:hypothetical protein